MAEMALSREEGVGTGAQLPPSKCVKNPWFQDKHWGTFKDFMTFENVIQNNNKSLNF